MIHNTGDIKVYSEPPPVGIPPVKHDRKWRRIFSMDWHGKPSFSIVKPTKFSVGSLLTNSLLNRRYNTKQDKIISFKSR